MDCATSQLTVHDLGRLAYEPALARQRAAHQRVLDGDQGPTLLLVEHDPVITISRRPGAKANLLVDRARLNELGIDLQTTDRGGDITYHGPGQLVAYPILRLTEFNLNVGRYMRLLEDVVMGTLDAFEMTAGRVTGCTGVWIEAPGQAAAKISALGIRVKRNVSLHGLAINVNCDLSHFQTIVPCGLTNRNVTSMREQLAADCPAMQQVKDALVVQLARRLESLRHHDD